MLAKIVLVALVSAAMALPQAEQTGYACLRLDVDLPKSLPENTKAEFFFGGNQAFFFVQAERASLPGTLGLRGNWFEWEITEFRLHHSSGASCTCAATWYCSSTTPYVRGHVIDKHGNPINVNQGCLVCYIEGTDGKHSRDCDVPLNCEDTS
ncbi:uncharacterized protein L969DRAFT_85454 [Mixia osmundae IAM 14324]|uniref:uncharacterized protein n=1 Tax=Mixia osmundae (strain CBS 9802 / IAM 14324 / JCM 22182 / KY 12970) TaxID=764103 RepID=UPI0004A547A4|nr:uncharacterized protein L969DRAFT_85454 [Mixia osmundae IAM 14324]KEI41645.1 hypothetical protein L969DRAFT_85454 [Mixia osmundae IAM 14324]